MLYLYPVNNEWTWSQYLNKEIEYNKKYRSPSDIRVGESTKVVTDIWDIVPIPPPPEIKNVTIDPKTTALLILDMETLICKSPRCTTSVSNIYNLMTKANQNGMMVVYSLIPNGNPSDVISKLAPSPNNPIVKSSVDKFYQTSLEKTLQDGAIRTVIVTGYAANGAVLHTATGAAIRGFKVIVPVDCMSADNPYAEQYTAWHMLNSPGTRNMATLTKSTLMNFPQQQVPNRYFCEF